MKITLAICFLAACSCFAQNFAVLAAKDDASAAVGIPTNWPTRVQPIGEAQSLPVPYAPPWQLMTKAELDNLRAALEPAKELWNQIQGTKEERKQRVGQLLQERIESGQWEPNRLRLHALESELFGEIMKVIRLQGELLGYAVKAIAASTLTTNLTVPERARVADLRPQLVFPQAPDLTQSDRDRVMYITAELAKVEALWKEARQLRENIETNTDYVDPATLGTVTIGE